MLNDSPIDILHKQIKSLDYCIDKIQKKHGFVERNGNGIEVPISDEKANTLIEQLNARKNEFFWAIAKLRTG